jgi:N-acetylglucosamine-6-phosphate deacetylase
VTLITDEWSQMLTRLARLRELRAASADLTRAIAGWHLEGPFLSPEPGFHGVHDPRWMLDPTPARLRELRAAAGDDPVLLTVAPERSGAIAAIQLATELGMRVSLGHTNASAPTLQAAVDAGARGFTHLGNACPQQLDRHDNILWRVLDGSALMVSLIPDEIHVAPPLFRLVHRLLGDARIYYTTDAMAAAGAPPGRYPLGPLTLEVGEDGIVRQPGCTNFAGSALRPLEGVRRAARMRDCSWREAWAQFSLRPVQLMGWPEPLVAGVSADFCLLQTDAEGALTGLQLFRAGQQIV